MNKKDGKIVICPADSSNPYFKRDVSSIIKNLTQQLREEKPIEEHVFSVLMSSECGKKSLLGQHLNYKVNFKKALTFADHDYCKVSLAVLALYLALPRINSYQGMFGTVRSAILCSITYQKPT